MRGQSRESLAELTGSVEDVLRGSDAGAVGAELFELVDVLDSSPALRRALTDAARPVEDRRALFGSLIQGKVADATATLACDAAALSWSRVRDLGDALEHLAVLATVIDADGRGALAAVENQLHEFARVAEEDTRIAAAFADRSAPLSSREQLADDLLDGRADPSTVALVHRAVRAPRAGHVAETVADFAKVAAALRDRVVAQVRTATPLTDAQREKLEQLLSRQYRRQVFLNVDVRPDLIGGLSVSVGDDLIDGSLKSRLGEARRAIAG